MNAKTKATTPRKSAKSKTPQAAAAVANDAQTSTVATAAPLFGSEKAAIAAGTAQAPITNITYTSESKTKKGSYHAVLSTNMVGVAAELPKAARVPFKEIGLLSAFAVDKRYAVKTGNRTYVVMQPKTPLTVKAGKDLMVTPLDAEFVTSGMSDFTVAPPTPKQLAKTAKAEKRATKKAEKALVKPNGAKPVKIDKKAKPVLAPQAVMHPHPPVGGAAQ